MSRRENIFLSLEEMRPPLKSLYNQNRLEKDLADRGMERAAEIIRECFENNLSLEEVFERLGQDEATRGDIQEIRSLLRKYKVGK